VHIWVIDTSAILDIRRNIVSAVNLQRVYRELDSWVHRGALTYPPQVLGELQRGADTIVKKRPGGDPPLTWAKKNETTACRFGPCLEGARLVLNRVSNLIDPDKVSIGGVDDADPYVIATAVTIRDEGHVVTIVTEDFITTPHKTALADAAGLFLVPTVRARTFLRDEEIWLGGAGE
jgi:hypothetical protein